MRKQNKKGITLIALVITVIILLILAGTAITLALDGGGLFAHANNAATKWNTAVATEEQKINEVWNILNGMTGESEDEKLIHATSMTISTTGNKTEINVDEELQLSVTTVPSAITDTITWSSSDNSKATIDNTGLVKGVTAGTVTITATAKDSSGNVQCTDEYELAVNAVSRYEGNIGRYVHYGVDLGVRKTKEGLKTKIMEEDETKTEAEAEAEAAMLAVDDDWVVFYEDEETGFTYLIASDYVPKEKIPTGTSGTNPTGLTPDESTSYLYNVYWKDSTAVTCNSIAYKNNRMVNKFLTWARAVNPYTGAVATTKSASTIKEKAMAHLLNKDAWSVFALTTIDSRIEAYGGPTLELWAASWKQRGYSELFTASSESGYYVGNTTNPTSLSYNVSNMDTGKTDRGIGNKVYFPHKTISGYCYGYWLATHATKFTSYPSFLTSSAQKDAYDKGAMLTVSYDGSIGPMNYASIHSCIRPVVSLPTSIIQPVESTSGVYYIDGNVND